MPTPIIVTLDSDISAEDGTYPGYLYLPGEPVRALTPEHCDDTHGPASAACDYCGTAMGYRGTMDADTGRQVPQSPHTGDHDGIVSAFYAPVPGVPRCEAGWGHLRCLTESITDLATVESVTVGNFDPVTVDTTPGAHAEYVRVPA